MPIYPFKTDKELCNFARVFIKHLEDNLHKNIQICLTKNKSGSHAYFPALMACFGYLEMLAGFYIGDTYPTRGSKNGIWKYMYEYMDRNIYSEKIYKAIYYSVRHKVAHQSHPCFVTYDKKNKLRFTWTITAAGNRPAVSLKKVGKTYLKQKKGKLRSPWPVWYDHLLKIHLRSFKCDIVTTGDKYLSFLSSDPVLRTNFAKCMKEYFPP